MGAGRTDVPRRASGGRYHITDNVVIYQGCDWSADGAGTCTAGTQTVCALPVARVGSMLMGVSHGAASACRDTTPPCATSHAVVDTVRL